MVSLHDDHGIGGVKEVFDVVVAGASYSGLSSAIDLLSSGLKVLVVDINPGLIPGFYYGGVDGRVLVSRSIWEKIGFRRNNGSEWVYSIEVLSRMITRLFDLGGYVLFGYRVEPLFSLVDEEIVLSGVVLKTPSEDEEFIEDKMIVKTRYLVDASGLSATPSVSIIESLKPGIVPQGPGPVIPGSREVIDRTDWVIEDMVIATGLSAASIFGASLPFPDITPLIESGFKASKMIKESISSSGNRNRNKDKLSELYGLM